MIAIGVAMICFMWTRFLERPVRLTLWIRGFSRSRASELPVPEPDEGKARLLDAPHWKVPKTLSWRTITARKCGPRGHTSACPTRKKHALLAHHSARAESAILRYDPHSTAAPRQVRRWRWWRDAPAAAGGRPDAPTGDGRERSRPQRSPGWEGGVADERAAFRWERFNRRQLPGQLRFSP